MRDLAISIGWSGARLLKQLQNANNAFNLNSSLTLEQIRSLCTRLKLTLDTTPAPSCAAFLDQLVAATTTDVKLLQPRPPVVTVLGHVDHGKTTLLEQIRRISLRAKEHGGITQHLGIYQVPIPQHKTTVTFLDTPGHEVFTRMRAFGAAATDIALLVVAADDGVKPQTVEAVKHAQAAHTTIMVFINKMDRTKANPQRVLKQLSELHLVAEKMGGDTMITEGSALQGQGIAELVEAINLMGEVLELKANPTAFASGVILDSYRDAQRGSVVALLVQNGTLHKQDVVVADGIVAKVKMMRDTQHQIVNQVTAGHAVRMLGFSRLPTAGRRFVVIANAHWAVKLAAAQQQELLTTRHNTNQQSSADVFAQLKVDVSDQTPPLNLILKADTSNTLLAVANLIANLQLVNVQPNIIHQAVGMVSENDLNLAIASQAWIVSFNVGTTAGFVKLNQTHQVKLLTSRVIYEIGETLAEFDRNITAKQAQTELGHLTVLKTFSHSQFGTIAGCRVDQGEVQVNSKIKLMRQQKLIHAGTVVSLKHLKQEIQSATAQQECGLTIKNFQDIKVGDTIVVTG